MIRPEEWNEILMNSTDEPDELMTRDGSLIYIGDYTEEEAPNIITSIPSFCADYSCETCEDNNRCLRRRF